MVKERKGPLTNPLVVNQPAGHVESNETLEQAIIREVLEETGWEVKPTQLLGLYAFTPNKGHETYHRVCFICEPIKTAHSPLDPDIDSCAWLTKAEVYLHPLRSPLVKQCIEDFENGLTFPLSLLNNTYLSACDNYSHEVQ